MSSTKDHAGGKKFVDTFSCTYILSVLAASIAELFTYPLDLIKTRLHIQGELAKKSPGKVSAYRGFLGTAEGIIREEGIFKLWRGLSPAIYRHAVYSGVRVTIYDYLRTNVFKKNEDGSMPIWKSVTSGAIAGGAAQLCATPADLVKVQMQMEGRRRLMGEPPRIKGVWNAFTKIYGEGGVVGLWKGSGPSVGRAICVTVGDIAFYDVFKQFFLKHTFLEDNRITHFISSGCAGIFSAIISNPADVLKSRIMNQPTDSEGKGLLYKSTTDCLMKTIKNEGVFALYKGFIPLCIRLTPWSLAFWVSFEQMKEMIGARSF